MEISKKRLLVVARKAILSGIGEAFQFSLSPNKRYSRRSPSDDAKNIAGYWTRTGSYLRNAMGQVEKELPIDKKQMSLFDDDYDSNPSHHGRRREPTASR